MKNSTLLILALIFLLTTLGAALVGFTAGDTVFAEVAQTVAYGGAILFIIAVALRALRGRRLL